MSAQQQAFDESSWKNLFVPYLKDIPKNVNPRIEIEQDDALDYIEELLLKLMSRVLEKNPHSVQDLEKIINSILPSHINEEVNKETKRILNECLETNHHDSNSLIHRPKKIVHLVSNSSSISNQQPRVNLANCKLVMSSIITQIQQKCKLDIQTSICLCALLEIIAKGIFMFTCRYVENIGNDRIKRQDVRIALNADSQLLDLFYGVNDNNASDSDEPAFSLMDELSNLELNEESKNGEGPSSVYVSIVKELIKEERSFLRELNLIIKVFREPFIRLLNASNSVPNTPTISSHNFNSFTSNQSSMLSSSSHSESTNTINSTSTWFNEPIIREEDIDLIFSNVTDIYEFSINFLSSIEDTIEMNEESQGIGFCFEEMAESMEFEVFRIFVEDLFGHDREDVVQPHRHLKRLFENQRVVSCLSTSGKGVLLCIKYVLPKLLNGVIVHCLHYFEYIKFLMNYSPNEDDRESLRQSEGPLNQVKSVLERVKADRNFKLNEGYLKLTKTHRERQLKTTKGKLDELNKKIDGFNSMQYNQLCNEFIYEGILSKARKGDKKGLKQINENKSERYCFLFDGLLICCKMLHNNVSGGIANNFDYKKKDIYKIRNLEVCDGQSDPKSFELVHNNFKDSEHKEVLIFLAKSKEEKDIWISNLLMLTQKPMLERTLDSILSEEERRIPLKLPDVSQYRFAEKDSEDNIKFDSSSGKDLIKEATLTKLIERLTYHQFADPKLLKTFLTTYRSFCTPEMLLDLLIERFNIPYEDEMTVGENSRLSREEMKRFKKEYLEPIQLRVLNAMKLWVESHYYDLNDEMKAKLTNFLQGLQEKQRKNLKKWVDSLLLRLEKKATTSEEKKRKYLCENLPPILYLYENERNEFNLLTLHPVEFSRQLTLYEFDLYCAVDTFELMGAKWTKEDKYLQSPNIMKLIQHNSNFTYWIEKEIVECPNLEERQAMVARLVEMLQVLFELNNFNGLFEIISALESASLHRLEATFEELTPKSKKIVERYNELLNKDHFQRYQEHLRSINPPCVPFFGCYLTQLVYLEEDGNKDSSDKGKQLIKFSKRRKIAEITSEIQQYQNQPYCLNVYPELREFIENLDPLEGRSVKEFEDYVFHKSTEIEPRGIRPPRAERKYKELNLKSPGIKPSHNYTPSVTSLHHSFSSNISSIVSNHNHQTSTSSMTNDSNNNTNTTTQQRSNQQTPNHTPSSSMPTSPTQAHSSSSNQLSPKSPSIFENVCNRTVMAPILIGHSHQPHLFINNNTIASQSSHAQFRVPTTPNPINTPNVLNQNNGFPSSLYLKNQPPQLPPRSSFSSGIHQRTNSESSNTSNASPNLNFHQSNSAFNTPLLSTGPNRENFFQYPNPSILSASSNQPPPLPPKSRLTPSQSPSPFFTPNSTITDSSIAEIAATLAQDTNPPPLPPKKNRITHN